MSPERFVKGESERTEIISVELNNAPAIYNFLQFHTARLAVTAEQHRSSALKVLSRIEPNPLDQPPSIMCLVSC
jgi:hypothetical protein